uniref:Uncharacterized protein n=1 Tax=Macrostomum lignano TaxID=282301 RepID=A0A1I8FFM9_9PLAT
QQRQGVQPGLVADSVDLQAVNVDARVDLLLQRQAAPPPVWPRALLHRVRPPPLRKVGNGPLIVGLGVFHQHLWLRYHNVGAGVVHLSQFSTCRQPWLLAASQSPRCLAASSCQTGALNFSRFGSPRPCCNLSIGLFSSLSRDDRDELAVAAAAASGSGGRIGRASDAALASCAARSGCWRRTLSPKSKFRPAPSSSGGSRGSGTMRTGTLDRIGGLQEEDRDRKAYAGVATWKDETMQHVWDCPATDGRRAWCCSGLRAVSIFGGAANRIGQPIGNWPNVRLIHPTMASRNFSTSPLVLLLLLLLGCTAFAAESRMKFNAEKRAYFDPINYGKKSKKSAPTLTPINYG